MPHRTTPFRFSTQEAALGLAAALLALVAACANPVPPGGGPRDERPPRITESRPAAEATGVRGRSVGIQFDEYVERSTLREALTVTPAPQGPLDFDWSRRSVEITFPEPFRDSTTYLLTIDTALQDVRGVSLETPITLAFATGDQIDRGRLAGRVIGNTQGQGREGLDVYAYAASVADSARLPKAPLYRTQTGPDGTFAFSYLREDRRYYVVALRDRNRNYRADPLEPFAAPPSPSLAARAEAPAAATPPADTSGGVAPLPDTARSATGPASDQPAPWVAGARDPVPPRLTRALPLSQRRVALRFSEPIRLQSRAPERFAITDTLGGGRVAVQSVYRRPGQAQRLTLRTGTAMQGGTEYRARLRTEEEAEGNLPLAVTDTSGNAPERPARAVFTASERPDTLGLRFLEFRRTGPPLPVPEEGQALVLAPGQFAAVQFNQPLGLDSTAARRLISARDTTTGEPLPFRLTTDDGTTYRLRFAPALDSSSVARLRVNGRRLRPPADTAYTRLARRLASGALGAVSGVVRVAPRPGVGNAASGAAAADSARSAASDSAAAADLASPPPSARPPVVVELYAAGGPASEPLRTTRADSSGVFVFRNLPEASYRFRAFRDRDRDGAWDAGQLAPYRPAEALAWNRRPLEARPRWEVAAGDTLRITPSIDTD